jgi:hypothetical protein
LKRGIDKTILWKLVPDLLNNNDMVLKKEIRLGSRGNVEFIE